MNAVEILSHFEQVRRVGNGWTAKCPAHEDRNPSLSIREEGGTVLLFCHAGCSVESVCEAARLKISDLFLAKGSGSSPQIVAEYTYLNEEGEILYQVLRYEPKSFKQRQPDGNGGWGWNLKGVRRVLYRLPDVLKAKSVLVVEGEKDCETARNIGLFATCNSGGAGKWSDEHSESLRGKRVAIIADTDEPGRKHAQTVAASLFGKTESLKLIELPGAKDLSEWIERGGIRNALLELIRNSPEWRPSAQPARTGGFNLTKLEDLLNEPEEAVSWLLADKLPAGGISVLAAKPKVGKSTLARCLALAVARGEEFLGCETTQGPVVYLALEEKRSEVRRHFYDLGATGSEQIHIHCAAAPQDAMVDLCRLTNDLRPVLVIVDPLFKFVRIKDDKAYAEICQALEPFLILARATGTHVMLVHHCGKSEKTDAMDTILGSTSIFGGVDSGLVLKRNDRYRTLQSSQRYGVDWPETVLEFDPDSRSLSLGTERSEADVQAVADSILDYLRRVEELKTEPEIEKSAKGNTGTKRKALRMLVEQGKVSRGGSGKRGDPFKYGFPFSRSPHIEGTREQETENSSQTLVNTDDNLVPDFLEVGDEISESREQEFLEGKL